MTKEINSLKKLKKPSVLSIMLVLTLSIGISIGIVSAYPAVDYTIGSGAAPANNIVYDNINIGHQMVIGIPNPTDNQERDGLTYKIEGIDTFNLNDFPLDNLPSGGNSLRVSPSEMVLFGIHLDSVFFEERDLSIQFLNSEYKQIYKHDCEYLENPCHAFIGHFDWEINKPGTYYIVIRTSHGNAELKYNVVMPISTPTVYATSAAIPVYTPTVYATSTAIPVYTPTVTSTVTPVIVPVETIRANRITVVSKSTGKVNFTKDVVVHSSATPVPVKTMLPSIPSIPSVPSIPSIPMMTDSSRKELDRYNQIGAPYEMVIIKDNKFVPFSIDAKHGVSVFLWNQDATSHYIKFSDVDGYFEMQPGTILSGCCGVQNIGTIIQYQDRDYTDMKGRTVVTDGVTVPVETIPVVTVPVETIPVVTVPVETIPVVTVPVETMPVVTVTVTPVTPVPDPGCWNSYVGFGMCVGDRMTQTGIGIVAGIGKAIYNIFGGS